MPWLFLIAKGICMTYNIIFFYVLKDIIFIDTTIVIPYNRGIVASESCRMACLLDIIGG